MTFSADGTSHRSINYNSRHVHLLAEDYTAQLSGEPGQNVKQRVTRTFGIQSSRDGSSEEAMADWEITLKKIIDVYNGSPLGKRSSQGLLSFVNLLIKLMGMNTDHCAKEKKDARLFEELKEWAVNQHLGEEKMMDMEIGEIVEYFKKAEEKMIKQAGGKKKWDALSEIKKAEKKAAMLDDAISDLGKDTFKDLSSEEKALFRLFIWAGCGCHKDLNTVRGGYVSMSLWWEENEIDDSEKPVLLANRDNEPVVKERIATLQKGDSPTPAQERALRKSTCGAIKAAEIAGAIFNHKDDKKGHHDVFRYWWWQHVGTPFTFPDTSNNRFQSYCDAAEALLFHKDRFIEFLESLQINKQNSTLNHMETNLWNALHCQSTLTELAVLAIYAEAISYPYMKSIRDTSAGQQNMLDLGPLHNRVYEHMQKRIENPDILIGTNTSHSTASFNGEEWENPDVVEKVLELVPTLPHFRSLLHAFLTGAAETWERFTSEFAPGGLIDEATKEEKELAWMPATNDENEGALGSFRVLMRRQPQLTLLGHNALAMFFRNNTQAFMAAKFTDEDFAYVRKLARESVGEEKKRRQDLIDFRDKKQAEKLARKEVRQRNAAVATERRADLVLMLTKSQLPNLKGVNLHDQYKLFKDHGAPNLQKPFAKPTNVAGIREALSISIELYLNKTWNPYITAMEDEDERLEQAEGSNDMEYEEDDEDDWDDM